jgi:hypothetical protein
VPPPGGPVQATELFGDANTCRGAAGMGCNDGPLKRSCEIESCPSQRSASDDDGFRVIQIETFRNGRGRGWRANERGYCFLTENRWHGTRYTVKR